MSLATTRTYFKARMTGLGYEEWEDGFNFDNIPENIIDKAFHIENIVANKIDMNHTDIHLMVDVNLRVFFKGYQSIREALDLIDDDIEEILIEVLRPSNRLIGADGLRDIQLDGFRKLPIASNDNSVIVEMNWKARVVLVYC